LANTQRILHPIPFGINNPVFPEVIRYPAFRKRINQPCNLRIFKFGRVLKFWDLLKEKLIHCDKYLFTPSAENWNFLIQLKYQPLN